MSSEDDYLKRLIQRAEELMVNQSKDESIKKLQPPEDKPAKQKRFYSEQQKEKLRERLELARQKSKEVRELKKNIKEIKSVEIKEEKEEKKAKFNEQSLEDKIEKIKQIRQYNPPKEEIQGPKVDPPPVQPQPPQPQPVAQPQPAAQPAQPPQPIKPKYFLPSMKNALKHKFINVL